MGPWTTITGWLLKARDQSPSSELRKPQVDLRRDVDLLRAAERDSIVASHLNACLQQLGFVQIAPRRWVDGSTAPTRRVFEMQLLKGATMKARWGFSLDFVPHLSGSRVYWHRSNRTAQLDVVLELDERKCNASFLHGAAWLHRDLERLAPAALQQAQETWRRGSTLSGILDVVRELRERKINSFYVHFNWHLPLAFMFLSAKIGDLAAAQLELEAYARKYELDEDVVAKLSKLIQDTAPVKYAESRP
jgi:hypothetical protein